MSKSVGTVPDLRNITVNGIPLKIYVDEEIKTEIQTNYQQSVADLSFVKQVHITSKFRNTSGSRSGKGRVIYSRPNIGGAL